SSLGHPEIFHPIEAAAMANGLSPNRDFQPDLEIPVRITWIASISIKFLGSASPLKSRATRRSAVKNFTVRRASPKRFANLNPPRTYQEGLHSGRCSIRLDG